LATGQKTGIIHVVGRGDELIELGQRTDLGDRHQMAAAKPPDLSFHTALLVATFLTRTAKERIEAIMAAQRDEPFSFLPATPTQDSDHR
jgi:hypothetical protein